MEFGNRILELRKKENLTQEELAEKVGVTRQTISKWELGETYPDLNMIIKLAKAFNVSTDKLIGGKEPSNKQLNITNYIGIFFTDLFSFMFFIVMFLFLIVVLLFSLSCLFVGIFLLFNISVSNIVPYMPLVPRIFMTVSLILLSVLSILGFIYLKEVFSSLVSVYLNHRNRVLLRTNEKKKFVLNISDKYKKIFVLVTVLFITSLILTIFISIIKSNSLDFWHEWKWFI